MRNGIFLCKLNIMSSLKSVQCAYWGGTNFGYNYNKSSQVHVHIRCTHQAMYNIRDKYGSLRTFCTSLASMALLARPDACSLRNIPMLNPNADIWSTKQIEILSRC